MLIAYILTKKIEAQPFSIAFCKESSTKKGPTYSNNIYDRLFVWTFVKNQGEKTQAQGHFYVKSKRFSSII